MEWIPEEQEADWNGGKRKCGREWGARLRPREVWKGRIKFSPGRVTTLSDTCVLLKNAELETQQG